MPYARKKCRCGREFQPRAAGHDLCVPCRVETKAVVAETAEDVRESVIERAAREMELDDATAGAVIGRLRTRISGLNARLEEAKLSKAELVAAAHDAAATAIEGMQLPPVPRRSKPQARKDRTPEVAAVCWSDWQLGKTTPTYSSEVLAKRISTYVDKALRLTDIQRSDHDVPECRVWLLGDMVEGELIFPGQAHHLDASLFRQVMDLGPEILGNGIRRLAAEFDRVHVECVIGNHGAVGGRSRRESHPETNADAMLYEVTRKLTASDRVTWGQTWEPHERHWYVVDRVGDYGYLLFHGDQVTKGSGGFGGIPWYPFSRALQGWQTGGIREEFHYAFCGHFHTPATITFGVDGECYVSGSPESDNTYASELLKARGRPSQNLFFLHPKVGITGVHKLKLS